MRRWAGGGRPRPPPRCSPFHAAPGLSSPVPSRGVQQLIHPVDHVPHLVEVPEWHLRRDPAVIADLDESLTDGGPADLFPFAEPILEAVRLGVFLDVDLEDPPAQL